MQFDTKLTVDKSQAQAALGAGGAALPEGARAILEQAARAVEEAARARWAYGVFPLGQSGSPPPDTGVAVGATGLVLPGNSIRAHLEGCEQCVFLALTLGEGVDRAIRAAGAADVEREVYMDTAASTLAEQYADQATRLLGEQLSGWYLTARFSPGYGDLPLAVQPELLRLLDAGRAIGLQTTVGGILTPRKSITAVLGAARHPVSGALAGCDSCALRDSCDRTKACGQNHR